jgi:hypothetical protein
LEAAPLYGVAIRWIQVKSDTRHLFAADQPNSPAPLRRALATIDRATGDYLADAGLKAA